MATVHEVRVERIFFLARVGKRLREDGSDIVKEELPAEIVRCLRKLEAIGGATSPNRGEQL